MTQSIPCPECGQINMITNPLVEKMSDEEKLREALLACNCPAGRAYRAEQSQITAAKENIEELCGTGASEHEMTSIENKDVIAILNKAAELIAEHEIFELQIKVTGRGNVKISNGSKGKITVKRSVGFSEQLDAVQKT